MVSLKTNIESLPATSAVTIKRFKELKIDTFGDLLDYFPFRYEDYRLISKINLIQQGEEVTVVGEVVGGQFRITRTGLKLQVFQIKDSTGTVEVGFYNQSYLLRLLKKGSKVAVSGIVEKFGNKIVLKPKSYEIVHSQGKLLHCGRLVPIYPEKRGLSSKTIREKIFYVLNQTKIEETLPEKIIVENGLIGIDEAYRQIHFPDDFSKEKSSRQRLAFDELFFIQLSSLLTKKKWQGEKVGHQLFLSEAYTKKIGLFIDSLPFVLTKGQKKVWNEISSDLLQKHPMNRFLQGEVGSGKTVIAALSSYLAFLNGYRTLLMAPTEILSTQHYQTFNRLFGYLNIKDRPSISLVTGNRKLSKNADIIIGTHAIFSAKRSYEEIALVIVDEQHRFGVAQRDALKKKGLNPHLLTMTATPIPRTVALTLYQELDISVIGELPRCRKTVKTFYVPQSKRNDGYEWIKKQVKEKGTQVFIVCPFIEESTIETMKSVKAAKKEFEKLKKIFSNFKLGLLHGKMKSAEKEKVMKDFRDLKFNILVSTPVVEVGVDIPQASIMVIEGAERFGLAQLHQLRGRVGRGEMQSYCLLYTETENPRVVSRLRFFAQTTDGNKLAQKDLEIRGPGNIYGLEQHGFINLKIASLSDMDTIEKSKKAVEEFVKKGLDLFERTG